MGSSGSSTYPHLHLEFFDINNKVIDPLFDQDNADCSPSLNNLFWEDQEPYVDPVINELFTTSELSIQTPSPISNADQENYYYDDHFVFGEEVHLYAAYKGCDLENHSYFVKIIRPDSTTLLEWEFSCITAGDFCNTSGPLHRGNAWRWTYVFQSSQPCGERTFQIETNKIIYRHKFQIGESQNTGIVVDGPADICIGH